MSVRTVVCKKHLSSANILSVSNTCVGCVDRHVTYFNSVKDEDEKSLLTKKTYKEPVESTSVSVKVFVECSSDMLEECLSTIDNLKRALQSTGVDLAGCQQLYSIYEHEHLKSKSCEICELVIDDYEYSTDCSTITISVDSRLLTTYTQLSAIDYSVQQFADYYYLIAEHVCNLLSVNGKCMRIFYKQDIDVLQTRPLEDVTLEKYFTDKNLLYIKHQYMINTVEKTYSLIVECRMQHIPSDGKLDMLIDDQLVSLQYTNNIQYFKLSELGTVISIKDFIDKKQLMFEKCVNHILINY